MEEVEKKTITVRLYQHDAIIARKKGAMTIYDVMDDLLEQPRLRDIESTIGSISRELEEATEILMDIKKAVREAYARSHDKTAKDRKIDQFSHAICLSVHKNIDKDGAVYTTDIVEDTKASRETIAAWLRRAGFVKTGGNTSRRWQNRGWNR